MSNLLSKLPPANRLAAYLVGLSGLCTALAPVVASADLKTTGGLAAGSLIVLGTFREWLKGWRQHEALVQRLEWGSAADPPAPSVTVEVPKSTASALRAPAFDLTSLMVEIPNTLDPTGPPTRWVRLDELKTAPTGAAVVGGVV